jgi:dephospho-CoA kinase
MSDAGARVRRVALTGGIATGKSHVLALAARLGVPTIDADLLAREAVSPGSPGLAAVVERFGPRYLDGSGHLDRRALGELVFRDASARGDLERIVHPEVRRRTDSWFAALDPAAHPFAIADIPLLYETGRDADFDKVIVTACDQAAQIRRIVERDSLTEAEARQRIAAQMPLDEKIRRADFVIRTDGAFVDTEKQVRAVLKEIARSG